MSLDVALRKKMPIEIYSDNITHNLNQMAKEAGVYQYLWRPDEIGITRAEQLIEPLKAGLERLNAEPEKYKQFDAENGWGSYGNLVYFVEQYLDACQKYPDAEVWISR